MIKPWSRAEFVSLLDCLRRHSRTQDAVIDHNRLWKTGRSCDSVKTKIGREGRGSPCNYLRLAASRKHDLPAPEQVKLLVDLLRKKPSAATTEICNDLDLSPRRLEGIIKIARDMDYRVEMPTSDRISLNVKAPPIDRLAVHRLPIEPVTGHIRFAVASDIHFASKLHRGECLSDFIDMAYELGIRTVLNPGDIFAGINMYRGQLNEITGWAMEHQLNEGMRGLPRRTDLTYHMIGGNHDESYMKASGGDIISAFGKRRTDVKTYGFYSALIDLTAPEAKRPIKIELHHPENAGAYAISYHVQKEIEQIPGGMKPQLLFMGHTHQSILLPDYRNVAAFYCGTFEDQTLYLKRKHLNPSIGGWLVDCGIMADGGLKSLNVTWVRYFHSRRGPISGHDEAGNTIRIERSLTPIGDRS